MHSATRPRHLDTPEPIPASQPAALAASPRVTTNRPFPPALDARNCRQPPPPKSQSAPIWRVGYPTGNRVAGAVARQSPPPLSGRRVGTAVIAPKLGIPPSPRNPSPTGAQAWQRSSSAGLARALGTFEEWEGAQQRQAKGGQREAAAGEVRQEVRQKPLADLESEQEVSKQAFSAAGLQTLKPHANP
jgi:hypothetical protein